MTEKRVRCKICNVEITGVFSDYVNADTYHEKCLDAEFPVARWVDARKKEREEKEQKRQEWMERWEEEMDGGP